jgi:hypothetical protein
MMVNQDTGTARVVSNESTPSKKTTVAVLNAIIITAGISMLVAGLVLYSGVHPSLLRVTVLSNVYILFTAILARIRFRIERGLGTKRLYIDIAMLVFVLVCDLLLIINRYV